MKSTKQHTKEKKHPRLRRYLMGGTVLGMLAVTGLQGTIPSPESAAADEIRKVKNVVYVSDQTDMSLHDGDAAYMDQINYAFAQISQGRATGHHWQGIRQMEAYLRRHPHITGVLAVGGWGADGFSQACATEDGRTALAESILNLMDEHGFTGVDIDWEYPGSSAAGIASSPDDLENWYALLALLRQGLDERTAVSGRRHILSVALGAGAEQLNVLDGKRLDSLVDQAVLMAYDLCGFDRQTGHHAGLYPSGNHSPSGANAVRLLTDSGFPAEKILLGIPAYGRMWRQVSGTGNGLHQRAATSGNKWLSYGDVKALDQGGYTAHYDEKAQAAWWFNGSSFVSAEDEQSLSFKAKWIQEQGLMGAAVWSYQHDTHGDVIKTLHRHFQ